MIKIFNDTQNAWRLGKVSTKGTVRISGGTKVEGTFKGVAMSVPAEGLAEQSVFSNLTQSSDMVTVYTGNTSVYYGEYDNMPNIGTAGTDKNFYFIAKDIKGCSIKNITKQDVFIFSYAIVKGVLYMILSVKPECKKIDITLYKKDTKTEVTTTFNLDSDTVTTSSVNVTTEPEMFKIRAFRPSRPTSAVLVKRSDAHLLPDSITNADSRHTVYEFDSNEDSGEVIGLAIKDGYSAITLFTALEDVIGNDFGEYDDIVTYLRSAFTQTNIMLGNNPNGKIVKR